MAKLYNPYEKIEKMMSNFSNIPETFALGILVFGIINFFFDYFNIKKSKIKFSTVSEFGYPISTEFLNEDGKKKQAFHDVMFDSPFEWLETLHSSITKAWIEAQQICYSKLFSRHTYQSKLQCFKEAFQNSSNFKVVHSPFQHGQYFFYFKKDKFSSEQASLYTSTDIRSEGKLILETQSLSTQGLILRGTWISNDGRKLLYGISSSVHDPAMTLFLRDVLTCEDSTIDVLHFCSAETTSISWAEGHSGFFYTCSSANEIVASTSRKLTKESASALAQDNHAPKINNCVCYHRVGTSQKEDLVVYSTEEDRELDSEPFDPSLPPRYFNPIVTHDGHYLLIEVFDPSTGPSPSEIGSSDSFDESSDEEEDLDQTSHPKLHNTQTSAASSSSATVPDTPLSPSYFSKISIDGDLGRPSLGNALYLIDLSDFDGKTPDTLGPLIRMIEGFSYRFDYITNIEEDFWFRTNFESASRFRVVKVSVPQEALIDSYDTRFRVTASLANTSNNLNSTHGARGNRKSTTHFQRKAMLETAWKRAREWIPEHPKGGILQSTGLAAHTILVLKYLLNGCHEVVLYDLAQGIENPKLIPRPFATLPHPLFGCVYNLNCSFYSSDIFYEFSGFADPSSVYRAAIARDAYTGQIEISFDQLCRSLVPGINLHDFETNLESFKVPNPDYQPHLSNLPSKPFPPPSHPSNNSTNYPYSNIGELSMHSKQNLQAASSAALASATSSHLNTTPIQIPSSSTHSKDSPLPVSYAASFTGSKTLDVPLYIFESRQNGLDRSPKPCILFCYGAFGVSPLPSFSMSILLFVNNFDGIFCVVGARGGGDRGGIWHGAGSRENKQRTMEDLLEASKYLIDNGYTTKSQLSLYGGSLGALAVSSVVLAHPRAFSAVALEDGVFDLMRLREIGAPHPRNVSPQLSSSEKKDSSTASSSCSLPPPIDTSSPSSHISPSTTQSISLLATSIISQELAIPPFTASSLTTPSSPTPAAPDSSLTSTADRLLSISPLHQISDKVMPFPAILVSTAIDSLVPCSHSFKFLAKLQSTIGKLPAQSSPIVLRVENSHLNRGPLSPACLSTSCASILSLLLLTSSSSSHSSHHSTNSLSSSQSTSSTSPASSSSLKEEIKASLLDLHDGTLGLFLTLAQVAGLLSLHQREKIKKALKKLLDAILFTNPSSSSSSPLSGVPSRSLSTSSTHTKPNINEKGKVEDDEDDDDDELDEETINLNSPSLSFLSRSAQREAEIFVFLAENTKATWTSSSHSASSSVSPSPSHSPSSPHSIQD